MWHKLKKIRKMSLPEIATRTSEVLYRKVERLRYQRSKGQRRRTTDFSGLTSDAQTLLPGSRSADVQELRSEHGSIADDWSRQARDQAAELLDGRWEFLGQEVGISADNVDWHRDPLSDYSWDRKYYHDLQLYELPGDVDIKYVWELSRHQFLVVLSRDWLFNREAASARQMRTWILDWITANRPLEGVNWTSALEVAVRSISWLWSLAMTADWDGWQGQDLSLIGGCLEEHAQYLYRHLSYYSSPYNHLIGEAAALYLLSHWLREHPRAQAWRTRSRKALTVYGPQQFCGDGFCVEQATGYHFFTLSFLCLAYLADRENDLAELGPHLKKAFGASLTFQQPNGRWPSIGDIDSARAMPINPDDFWDFRSLVALGAVLFEAEDLKQAADSAGQELFFLKGAAGVRKWNDLAQTPGERTSCLPDSGYAAAEAGEYWVLLDAGPLAHGLHSDDTPSVAHGHNDQLGLVVCRQGSPIVGDVGMPRYAGSREWVDYFRDTAAHSTICLPGSSPAVTAGRLGWARVIGQPRLLVRFGGISVMRGHLRIGTSLVERNILLSDELGLWMADYVTTAAAEPIQWHWQIPIDQPLEIDQVTAHRAQTSGSVDMQFWSSVPMSGEVNNPRDDSPVAWYAPGYGTLCPGRRVRLSTSGATTECLIVTQFGEREIPFTVRRGDQIVASGQDEVGSMADSTDGDSVIWSIGKESFLVDSNGSAPHASEWIPDEQGSGTLALYRQANNELLPARESHAHPGS